MKTHLEQNLIIKRVTEKSSAGIRTIRFYKQKVLIEPAARFSFDSSLFSRSTIKRVRFIKRAQALSLSFLEIRELLSLPQNASHARQEIYQKTAIKKINIEGEKINALQKIRHVLSDLMSRCKRQRSIKGYPIIKAF